MSEDLDATLAGLRDTYDGCAGLPFQKVWLFDLLHQADASAKPRIDPASIRFVYEWLVQQGPDGACPGGAGSARCTGR